MYVISFFFERGRITKTGVVTLFSLVLNSGVNPKYPSVLIAFSILDTTLLCLVVIVIVDLEI